MLPEAYEPRGATIRPGTARSSSLPALRACRSRAPVVRPVSRPCTAGSRPTVSCLHAPGSPAGAPTSPAPASARFRGQ